MQITVKSMLGKAVEKSEDCAEKVIIKIRPHAKGLGKFGILFFHILFSFLLLIEFKNSALFVGYSLGMYDPAAPCLKQDVEFVDHDLDGENPRRAKDFEDCLQLCNTTVSGSEGDSVTASCKAVTFTSNHEAWPKNCWMKEKTFKERDESTNLGFQSQNMNCKEEHERKPKKTYRHPKKTTNVMIFLTLLLLVTRVGPLILILLNKHVLPACGLLAVPLLIAIVQFLQVERFTLTYMCIISSILSLIGCLMMVVVDSMEENEVHIVGLPSWGINKRTSFITLLSRVNIVLIFFGLQMYHSFSMYERKIQWGYYLAIPQLLVLIPAVIAVVVGYKTKMMSVILASWLTLNSLIMHPFYLHFYSGISYSFWMDAMLFGVNFSGVGSLIYIAVLGAGAYSVDHVKKQ